MSQEASPQPTLQVVGAAILRRGRCLAAQRSATMPLPLQWEFPGGKVEPGEQPREALRREVREELGVEIAVGERLGMGTARAGDRQIKLTVFSAELVSGSIALREHAQWGWFTPEELRDLQWAEADVPIVGEVCAALTAQARPTSTGKA